MITKRKLGRGKVQVTFSMTPIDQIQELNLVGDFNDWSFVATPMRQGQDSNWTVVLSLVDGRDYQYRYLANGTVWHNDWAADAYLPNEFGSENSVISLKEAALPAAKKTTRKKST